MTKRMVRVPTQFPPLVKPGGIDLSGFKKAEALADCLESQFQTITFPSVPEFIEVVDVDQRSYINAPASERKLTKPDEVQEAIRSLKIGMAPGPNDIPNRALKHLPKRAVSLLVQIFDAVLRTHHFLSACKHARMISILKPRKDPAQPFSYRPISLLDTIGKLFDILLTKILNEVSECGLLRDEQFGFRPGNSTSLQFAPPR
jgi:hypothetical protein